MIPAGNHTDWPWPFSLIPRRWTAVNCRFKPHLLLGNVLRDSHLDIPGPGQWAISTAAWIPLPLYIAIRTKSNWYFAMGIRYDYIDKYYQLFRFTIKRYK